MAETEHRDIQSRAASSRTGATDLASPSRRGKTRKNWGLQVWLNTRVRRGLLSGGYWKAHPPASVLVNLFFAVILLLVAFPFFVLIPIIIKLQDGGPVFYRGTRLGRNKKPFQMYKFRTLVPDAESTVGARLHSPKMGLETPIGRFLRETRLDELPQMINVIKGDMDLVGPRPERPLIYETLCKNIPGYDTRFRVKPGVIGYSQLFTPPSAPNPGLTQQKNFHANSMH